MTDPVVEQVVTVQTAQGSRFGPANIDQLRAWASEGRINPQDQIITGEGEPPVEARRWPPLAGHLPAPGGEEAIATVIPFRNKPALIGYYMGIFGLIPLIGVPFAIAGIVLGVAGLRYQKRHLQAHGKAHAIVAVVCGGIGILLTLLIFVLPLVWRP